MKLKEKKQIKSRIVKIYEIPQTPYQRLMQSEHLFQGLKLKLQNEFQAKNPFYLKQQLDKKLKNLKTLIDIDKKVKSSLLNAA